MKFRDGEVFEGTTYLLDESNPKVQRFDVQTKFFPDQFFVFEVKFTPKELEQFKICKSAQFVNNGMILLILDFFGFFFLHKCTSFSSIFLENNARTFGYIMKYLQAFMNMLPGMMPGADMGIPGGSIPGLP